MRVRTTAGAALAGLVLLTAACTGGAGGSAQDTVETAIPSGPSGTASGAPGTLAVPSSRRIRSTAARSSATQSPVTDAAGMGGSPIDPAQFVSAVGPSFQGVTSITGSVTVDGPSLTEDGTYRGTYRAGKVTGMSVDMTITSNGKLLTLTMVEVDGDLFVRSAALAGELHLTKPWLSISSDSADPEIAQIATTLSAILDGIGPAEYARFAAAVLAASDLGQETVDGAPVHHFRALLDPTKSVAALDLTVPSASASAAAASSAASTPTTSGPVPVRLDVWLDQLGRVVTTTTTQTVAGQQIVSTNEVTSFNEPATITAPAPSDVAAG